MQDILIIAVLILALALGIRESIKHFRGEGGCCGGAANAKPRKKKLRNKVIHTYVLHIEGMHCKNCEAVVMRIINDFDGASGSVNRKKKCATIRCDRDVDLSAIKEKIQERGYTVS